MSPTAADWQRFQDQVLAEIRELRTSLDVGYVRKDVADREHAMMGQQILGIETEVHAQGKRFELWTVSHDARLERERDTRDAQRSRDRNLIRTFVIMGISSPVATAFILHGIGWHS